MPQTNAQRSRRRKPNTEGTAHPAALLLLLVTLTAATFYMGTRFAAPVSKVAMFSASLAMPQGTAQTIREELTAEETTEPATQAPAETTAAPAEETVSESALTDTPEDILAMMASAEAASANTTKKGAIVEKQYGAGNATDTWENITVRNTTASHSIDIAASVAKSASLSIENISEPLVLIFHTHTTECYELLDRNWYATDYITRIDDPARNMVRVGDAICEQLEAAGIGVIHDTEIHDAKYTGAYDRSRESIEAIMAEYPSIQVVIDVHRDSILTDDGTAYKTSCTIDGTEMAQLMFVVGTDEGGLYHPNWQQNLNYVTGLQYRLNRSYPGLMRPVNLRTQRFNQHASAGSMLIEVGSSGNTMTEALAAIRLFGQTLAADLTGA